MITPVLCPVPQISYNRPIKPCLVEQKTKLMHQIILTHLQRYVVIEEIHNEGFQMNAIVKELLGNEISLGPVGGQHCHGARASTSFTQQPQLPPPKKH